MTRVCGATGERDRAGQRRCWCNGTFCGRGGAKFSTQFRRAFHTTLTARSRVELEDLIAQADLFDQDTVRAQWLQRINRSVALPV